MTYLRNKIAVLLRFALLILFIGYYGGVTLFYHAHMVNGQVIVHSHPYRPSGDGQNPFRTHTHSKAVYAIIQQLDEICWENFGYMPQIPDPVFFSYACYSGYRPSFVPSVTYPDLCLRSPPAFCA